MHPFAKEEKSTRREKHSNMGVRGENDDEKAERLCKSSDGNSVKPLPEPKGE